MGKNSLFPQKPYGKSGAKAKNAVFAFASNYFIFLLAYLLRRKN